jgi:hypothetical protein
MAIMKASSHPSESAISRGTCKWVGTEVVQVHISDPINQIDLLSRRSVPVSSARTTPSKLFRLIGELHRPKG